jgi:hypothetical protein
MREREFPSPPAFDIVLGLTDATSNVWDRATIAAAAMASIN